MSETDLPDSDSTIEHRTHTGHTYRIPAECYRELRADVFAPRLRQHFIGAASAAVLAVALVVSHLAMAGGFGAMPEDRLSAIGLSGQSYGMSAVSLLSCLFLHTGPVHLLLNVTALLLFGCFVGWRLKWPGVLFTFVGGGIAGALVSHLAAIAASQYAGDPLTGSLTGLASFGSQSMMTVWAGADGASFALVASSMLVAPRLFFRGGWVPWNLLLGYAFLVTYAGLDSAGFTPIGAFPSSLVAGGIAGTMVTLMLIEPENRNDFRFAAVFLGLAILCLLLLRSHIAGILSGSANPLSPGLWASMLFDLFVVFVGSLYTTTQAEVVQDRMKFARQALLDRLVEDEGELVPPPQSALSRCPTCGNTRSA